MSYEVLFANYGATLRRTEMEIEYWPSSKITDYSITILVRSLSLFLLSSSSPIVFFSSLINILMVWNRDVTLVWVSHEPSTSWISRETIRLSSPMRPPDPSSARSSLAFLLLPRPSSTSGKNRYFIFHKFKYFIWFYSFIWELIYG